MRSWKQTLTGGGLLVLINPGGPKETGTKNRNMLRQMVRLASAVVLAFFVHGIMAGLILFEVLWQTPQSSSTPVLDLRPLAITAVMPGKQIDIFEEVSLPCQVPVRLVPDEVHLGACTGNRNKILRSVRNRINQLWQPAKPSGVGRAVILLTINGQGRVTSSQMVSIQGNDAFEQFMGTFLVRLGKVIFTAPSVGGDVRVECEFSVGE